MKWKRGEVVCRSEGDMYIFDKEKKIKEPVINQIS